jgi:hypothetical protein
MGGSSQRNGSGTLTKFNNVYIRRVVGKKLLYRGFVE